MFNMNIALTGSTGFIGQNLKLKLEAEGHSVNIIGRGVSAVPLAELLKTWKTDAVVHLASLFIAEHKPDQIGSLIQSNVLFGAEVLEAMALAGVKRIVNSGTSWQTFEVSGDSYKPVCLYAATKQAFEDILEFYVDAHGFNAVTLRIFDTYGPRDARPKLVPKLFEAAVKGTSLDLSPGKQEIDLLHIDDLIEAFLSAVTETESISKQLNKHRIYGLSSGRQINLIELVSMIEKTTAKALNVNWGARPYRTREVMKPTSDYAALPNWQARVDLEEGLSQVWKAHV